MSNTDTMMIASDRKLHYNRKRKKNPYARAYVNEEPMTRSSGGRKNVSYVKYNKCTYMRGHRISSCVCDVTTMRECLLASDDIDNDSTFRSNR